MELIGLERDDVRRDFNNMGQTSNINMEEMILSKLIIMMI